MTKRKIESYESSGNVFADLGLPNPEERLLKSSMVAELKHLISERDLTQVKAAKLIGISRSLICLICCVVTTMTIQPSV